MLPLILIKGFLTMGNHIKILAKYLFTKSKIEK